MLRFLTAASADMEPLDQHCVAMFDEMAIDSRLVYDRTQRRSRSSHTGAGRDGKQFYILIERVIVLGQCVFQSKTLF